MSGLKVSIIVPFVNEWPQIIFTIRAIKEQMEQSRFDYEIICIDNYCEEVHAQHSPPDRGHNHYVLNKQNLGRYGIDPEKKKKATKQIGHIMAQSRVNGHWLKCFEYDSRLSHWNAKNLGVEKSTGDFLLFLDAHVMPSHNLLSDALDEFLDLSMGHPHCTLHLPLSYHILEEKRLMYKLIYEPKNGVVHYSFTSMPTVSEIIEVPCMSTCGMIMAKSTFDKLGGWPEGMGIYGGGENYINYMQAVLGFKKFLYPHGCLHHHGDHRKYSFNWTDYHRNRLIATYLYGGSDMADKYQVGLGNNNGTKIMQRQALEAATAHQKKMSHLTFEVELEVWVKQWEGKRAVGLDTGKEYV